jgi:hypothetical protein
MSAIEIQLPESLQKKVREVAKRDNTTFDHFVALALAEKLSAMLTEEYLAERAARGDPKKYHKVLSKVPSVAPVPGDEF